MCALDNHTGQQPDPERSERFARLGLEDGDYYFSEEGFLVFTEKYHLKRGYCCQSRCRHCPYGNAPKPKDKRP